MRTEDFIKGLVADHAVQPGPRPMRRNLFMAIIAGFAGSLAVLLIALGVRPDIIAALETWRFDLKWVVTLTLAIAATWLALQLSKPTAKLQYAARPLLLPAMVLIAAVISELVAIPSSAWLARIGANGSMCVANIFFLSVIPFGAVLVVLREGAPASPAFAGMAAGLLAGAVAATAYVLHCPEDSPLFVAVWYMLAIGLVTLVGLFLGRHVLRW
jgi:hypothetical protein